MTAAELWAIAGLLLCAAELIAPGVFLLWIGLAAIGAGALAALFALGWHAQIAAFIALALILIAAVFRRVRPHGPDLVNAPNAGLVGSHCTALEFRGGEGRVRLRDGAWQARIGGTTAPAPGATLRVVGLDGTTLLVEKLPP